MNKQELIEQLKKENVPESYYSFSEKNWGDVYVLLQEKEYWEVYYTERGNKYDIKHFDNEEEACEYFLNKVVDRLYYKEVAMQWQYAHIAGNKIEDWTAKNNCSICSIKFEPYRGKSMDVYVFYSTDSELKQYIENGTVEKTKQEFLKILKEIGYIDEFNDNIRFSFDSDENVQRNCNGHYGFRLTND